MSHLEGLGDKVDDIAFEALEEGAKPMLGYMTSYVPVWEGRLKRALEAGGVTQNGTKIGIDIGIDYKEHPKARHAHLVEFGTVKMAAQPYIYPGYKKGKKEAIENMVIVFRRRLGFK